VTGYIGSFVLTRIVPGMFSKQAMIPFLLLLIGSIVMTLLLGFTTPLYIGIGLLVVLILIMMH